MTKDIKKIEQSIEQLNIEKEELKAQLKRIPQGRIIKKYLGHSLSTGQETSVKVLTLNYERITQEKLNELRKQAIEHNEPILKRLKEIDNILPRLEEKLNDAKANELINSDNKSKIKDTKNSNLRYGELEKIVMTTINSDKFKSFKIPKNTSLKPNQIKAIYNLACALYPDVPIKLDSFISKIKQQGYSKERLKPRTIKNS